MGARKVSPGGALLRSSRMFAMPKPLPEPPIRRGEMWSTTATQNHPRHQAITSPLSSREKGDWGLKRPLPLKQTMATTTPSVRIKEHDSAEKITDYASAADHALSLEKFGEMRIAMTIPDSDESIQTLRDVSNGQHRKSVFEEDMDFTTMQRDKAGHKRWKFRGPWLAKMTDGEFDKFLHKDVRPKRVAFRNLLKKRLARQMTARNKAEAREAGSPPPPTVHPDNITPDEFTQYLRSLRNDRATLYGLVSRFLDLAPLGSPIGFAQTGIFFYENKKIPDSPYGKTGPPPSHPSGGISYLRTNSIMDNHPVYGPQAHRSPVLSRIIFPRTGSNPAKVGVGGFVAHAPTGDNDFNVRPVRGRTSHRKPLNGITHLDINTFGGAKAYVDPYAASIGPNGQVVVKVRETGGEAQVIAKEARGQSTIYNDLPIKHVKPAPKDQAPTRMDRVTDEFLGEEKKLFTPADPFEKDIVSSSSAYGLDAPEEKP